MTLAEKIIKHIDDGWSPRVAAKRVGTSENMLMLLSKTDRVLRIKMDIYSLQRLEAKRGPEGDPVEIEWVDKRKGRRATRVDRYLPVNSPIYKRKMVKA